jgi:hypothetical protein
VNLAEAEIEVPANNDDFPSLRPADPISRNGVVQAILNLFDAPAYLEVGVNRGVTFNAVSAATKVAIDPKFLFDFEQVANEVPGTSFHETTSDEYFGRIAGSDAAFDLIYLDGLHTSEQTIRDLINAITFLKPNGVILIDDIFPSSYSASLHERAHTRVLLKATGDTSGAWMGDVYRLVFFVESFCQQLSYCTVNNNHGQLVMWREPRDSLPTRTLTEVGEKEYKDLFLEKETFRCASLEVILQKIIAARR